MVDESYLSSVRSILSASGAGLHIQNQFDLIVVVISRRNETEFAVKSFRTALTLSTTGVKQGNSHRFQVLDEFFKSAFAEIPALVRPGNHETPQEYTGAIDTILVIRAGVGHDEADWGLIGINGPHPDTGREMRLGN